MSCLVATLVAIGVHLSVPVSEAAAVTSGGSLYASPTRAIAGESVSLTGRLPQRLARAVVLQRKRGYSWVTVDRRRTTYTGRFAFTTRTRPTTTTYRVLAPRIEDRPTHLRQRADTTPHGDHARPAGDAGAAGGDVRPPDTVATATFLPARPGRAAQLQWRNGSTPWTNVDSGAENAAGKVSFTQPTEATRRVPRRGDWPPRVPRRWPHRP